MPDTESPYKLRKKAALRVDRLMFSMGPSEMMEDDDRYRENILGSKYRWPGFTAQMPMRKINAARDLADKVRAENQRNAQSGKKE
jgi:hypothetical protein